MKDYNFDWLDDLDNEETKVLGKLVSIFLRGITEEELAALDTEETVDLLTESNVLTQ